MSERDSFLLFVIAGLTWFLMWLQAHRLYHAFVAKYPKEAVKWIPGAFSSIAHPEKFLFFFRKPASDLLKGDADLWGKRRVLVLLLWLSALVPFGVILIVLITMALELDLV